MGNRQEVHKPILKDVDLAVQVSAEPKLYLNNYKNYNTQQDNTDLSSKTVPTSTFSMPSETDGKTYPTPDDSMFVFNPLTNMYVDHTTGLHYDPSSSLYYNNEIKKCMYYDYNKMKYMFAPDPLKIESDNKSQRDAMRLMTERGEKDMGKWQNPHNQIRSTFESPRTEMNTRNPVRGDSEKTIFSSREKNLTPPFFEDPSAGSPLGAGRKEASCNEDESFDDFVFLDFERVICKLCRRQLPSKEILVKHAKLSDLHIMNLEKYKASVGSNKSTYEDRDKVLQMNISDDSEQQPQYQNAKERVFDSTSATKTIDPRASGDKFSRSWRDSDERPPDVSKEQCLSSKERDFGFTSATRALDPRAQGDQFLRNTRHSDERPPHFREFDSTPATNTIDLRAQGNQFLQNTRASDERPSNVPKEQYLSSKEAEVHSTLATKKIDLRAQWNQFLRSMGVSDERPPNFPKEQYLSAKERDDPRTSGDPFSRSTRDSDEPSAKERNFDSTSVARTIDPRAQGNPFLRSTRVSDEQPPNLPKEQYLSGKERFTSTSATRSADTRNLASHFLQNMGEVGEQQANVFKERYVRGEEGYSTRNTDPRELRNQFPQSLGNDNEQQQLNLLSERYLRGEEGDSTRTIDPRALRNQVLQNVGNVNEQQQLNLLNEQYFRVPATHPTNPQELRNQFLQNMGNVDEQQANLLKERYLSAKEREFGSTLATRPTNPQQLRNQFLQNMGNVDEQQANLLREQYFRTKEACATRSTDPRALGNQFPQNMGSADEQPSNQQDQYWRAKQRDFASTSVTDPRSLGNRPLQNMGWSDGRVNQGTEEQRNSAAALGNRLQAALSQGYETAAGRATYPKFLRTDFSTTY